MLRHLVASLVLLLAGAASAQSPPSPAAAVAPPAAAAALDPRAGLDAARAELDGIEAALRRPTLSDAELAELRGRVDPIADRLRAVLAAVSPELDAARARLEGLGPKPKEGAPPEGAEVARDRAEREAAAAALDETARLARALLLSAEQLGAQAGDRRRAAFARALLERATSVATPGHWAAVARAAPRDLRAAEVVAGDALSRLRERAEPLGLTLLALAFGVGIALHLARGNIAPRLALRGRDAAAPSPHRKLVAALAVLAVETLPALAGSLVIFAALAGLDVLPGRLLPVAGALLAGLAFVAFAGGLAEAVLAPDRPSWRLLDVSDAAAGRTVGAAYAFAGIVAAGKVADAAGGAIAAGLPLVVTGRAVFALAAAAVLAEYLRRSAAPAPGVGDEACLGPYIPPPDAVSGGPLRIAGWALVAAVAGAALTGFVALASFLVDQAAWIASLAGLLFLGLECCDRFLGGALKEESRVSLLLQTNLGLRRRSLIQGGVLLAGIGRVVLVVVAALLALAPWGVQSADVATYLRAAFFGFQVGDVTVSVSTVVTALGLFALAVAATKVVQRWLERSFLPTTELDAGLRNSVTTAAGYAGWFGAAALAFAYLGLSLEKIAIVAGALSVGIGFGLQSIVNNFVSGLILLWERPIRVGDLVSAPGIGEGVVRRISVRATEIETVDRATLIVPNSSLVSGVVTNRVRGDRSGRIAIPIVVPRSQDPVRAADLVARRAAAHPDVAPEPPPRVLFKKIGDPILELELVCVVEDVAAQPRVQSELTFAIFALLAEERFLPPLGPGTVVVAGLEPVEGALREIAGAVARRAGA